MSRLVKQLQEELDQLYHNATPTYPRIDSDYEQDLFDSCFADYCSMSIDDLQHELPSLLEYGTVYTWGRGGRTLAPDGLVNMRGGSSFSIKKAEQVIEEYGAFKARALIKTLRQFDELVHGFNKYIPEWWTDMKYDNDYQVDIDKHVGKRRANKVVYI